MSTIDELRNELSNRAEDAPRGHHIERLAGIRRKRTTQRRTIAAGAAGATALAVAAVVALVPGNAELPNPTPPPATRPTEDTAEPEPLGAPVPVVEEKGVEFYETPGLGTLDGYAVGRPGQRRLEFSFIAGGEVLNYTDVCFGAAETEPPSAETLLVYVTVNGHPQAGTSCSPSRAPMPQSWSTGSSYATGREARIWESYGVVPGARVDVLVELDTFDRQLVSAPDVTIGAAFWSIRNAPEHQLAESVEVADVVEFEGVNYRYLESVSASVREGGSLSAPEHDAGTAVLALWGKVGSAGEFGIDPGGRGDLSGLIDAGRTAWSSHELVRSGDTSGTRVTVDRLRESTVTLWIALYEPIQ